MFVQVSVSAPDPRLATCRSLGMAGAGPCIGSGWRTAPTRRRPRSSYSPRGSEKRADTLCAMPADASTPIIELSPPAAANVRCWIGLRTCFWLSVKGDSDRLVRRRPWRVALRRGRSARCSRSRVGSLLRTAVPERPPASEWRSRHHGPADERAPIHLRGRLGGRRERVSTRASPTGGSRRRRDSQTCPPSRTRC